VLGALAALLELEEPRRLVDQRSRLRPASDYQAAGEDLPVELGEAIDEVYEELQERHLAAAEKENSGK